MKIKRVISVIILCSSIRATTIAQDFINTEKIIPSRVVGEKEILISQLKYGEAEADTSLFNYEKPPGRAFLFSAIVPGAGELYLGAKWRALLFAGLEATFWTGHLSYKNRGEKIEDEYMEYADEHWSLARWFRVCLSNEFNMLQNSHRIWIEWNGQEYEVNDSLPEIIPDYIKLADSGEMQPIRTGDFYENIGKYDQFSGGWDDFDTTWTDTIYMTPHRDRYLTMRYDSNKAFENATKLITAVMFNHLISAFDALIIARNQPLKEKEGVSFHIGALVDYRSKNPIKGLKVYINF